MCKAKHYVSQINSIFEQVKTDYEFYKAELSRLDKSEQDVLHNIENETMDAARGYCLAKQIQDIRIERRLVKLELDTLRSLYERFVNNNDKKVIEIENIISNKEKGLKNLIDNKIYNPKVLKEAK